MIDILVGSQMGAAEYVAEQVAETLVQAGYDVKLHLKPELDHLNQNHVWLVITSTYGAGDLPDNIQPFADQLAQDRRDLTTLSYAVITLGDSGYDTFCEAGRKIDHLLQKKRARRLITALEIDAQDPQLPEDTALLWLPQLIKNLR
ncbi:MAG: FMN-binding protein MioC [Alteromonadaceae bacterium]|jgi:MioC protein|uniref:FMN-binding protein MioC n=1 Tax=Rheinheimera TaxID=67575 RepID=UPI000C37B996|nr:MULTISPECIES: FMN-binding protein MioC [Rheinheimera]MBJ92675.1 FMN-binding protein MioC [Alteromonadaceae bacterium]MCD1596714.1 FMN-binding protein MioC [Rheinheimera aquimaris]HBN87537.1 FMN-binding protein MioC [Rheinheimera sp.]|tara:strand:+ start:4263 stop:4700 length:438 start_codon:yes stop_codon:yes gene_type:complete